MNDSIEYKENESFRIFQIGNISPYRAPFTNKQLERLKPIENKLNAYVFPDLINKETFEPNKLSQEILKTPPKGHNAPIEKESVKIPKPNFKIEIEKKSPIKSTTQTVRHKIVQSRYMQISNLKISSVSNSSVKKAAQTSSRKPLAPRDSNMLNGIASTQKTIVKFPLKTHHVTKLTKEVSKTPSFTSKQNQSTEKTPKINRESLIMRRQARIEKSVSSKASTIKTNKKITKTPKLTQLSLKTPIQTPISNKNQIISSSQIASNKKLNQNLKPIIQKQTFETSKEQISNQIVSKTITVQQSHIQLQLLQTQLLQYHFINHKLETIFEEKKKTAQRTIFAVWNKIIQIEQNFKSESAQFYQIQIDSYKSELSSFKIQNLAPIKISLASFFDNYQKTVDWASQNMHKFPLINIAPVSTQDIFLSFNQCIEQLQKIESLIKNYSPLWGQFANDMNRLESLINEETNELGKYYEMLQAMQSLSLYQSSLSFQTLNDGF